jgi:hypothetical protein
MSADMVKINVRMVSWVLFGVSVVLGLVSNFLIQDEKAKALLLYLSFGLGAAGFFQLIVYMLKPDLFKARPKREDYD